MLIIPILQNHALTKALGELKGSQEGVKRGGEDNTDWREAGREEERSE